jgi:hypothetical protein
VEGEAGEEVGRRVALLPACGEKGNDSVHAAACQRWRSQARPAYHLSIMKYTLAVLLLAMAMSAAAAEEPKKPAGFTSPATMCNGTYALCIKAPCEKKPDSDNLYPCGCVIQTGWNMGPNSCDDRQKNLTSTYSNLFNLGSSTVSCPASTQWAWCYGAQCEVDPRDPARAVCKCPASTKPTLILVADGMCSDPGKVCGMLWSGATPAESKFANEYYYWWMTTNGQQSNLPSQACPSSAQ